MTGTRLPALSARSVTDGGMLMPWYCTRTRWRVSKAVAMAGSTATCTP